MAEDINCIKVWHQCIFLQIKWLFMLIPRYKIIFSHQPLWTAHYVGKLSREKRLSYSIGTFRHNNAFFPPPPFSVLPEMLANLFWTQLNHISPWEEEGGKKIKNIFQKCYKSWRPLRIATESQEESFCITPSNLTSNFSLESCTWWQVHLF